MLFLLAFCGGMTIITGLIAGGIGYHYEQENTQPTNQKHILEEANKKLTEKTKGLERELGRVDQGFQFAQFIDSVKSEPSTSTMTPSTEPTVDLYVSQARSQQSLPYGFAPPNSKIAFQKKNPSVPRQRAYTRSKRSLSNSPWVSSSQEDHQALVPIEVNASVTSQDAQNTTFKTRVLESGLIAPDLGLVMEQTGSYMEYSGYIYVPMIYHMPHLAGGGLRGQGIDCNITANRGHQDLIIQLLKDKVGTLIPIRDGSRRKRFIETVLLGAAVAWNRASIWSLQDTVSSLEHQIQIIH